MSFFHRPQRLVRLIRQRRCLLREVSSSEKSLLHPFSILRTSPHCLYRRLSWRHHDGSHQCFDFGGVTHALLVLGTHQDSLTFAFEVMRPHMVSLCVRWHPWYAGVSVLSQCPESLQPPLNLKPRPSLNLRPRPSLYMQSRWVERHRGVVTRPGELPGFHASARTCARTIDNG